MKERNLLVVQFAMPESLKKVMQTDTLKSFMEEKKAFTCSICDYKFSQKGSLNLQIKRQHEICSMEFMKNTELAKHEKKI